MESLTTRISEQSSLMSSSLGYSSVFGMKGSISFLKFNSKIWRNQKKKNISLIIYQLAVLKSINMGTKVLSQVDNILPPLIESLEVPKIIRRRIQNFLTKKILK